MCALHLKHCNETQSAKRRSTDDFVKMTKHLLNESISGVFKLLKSNKLSSEELTRLCLKRADHIRSLNAYITICDEHAIECAKRADQRFVQNQTLHSLDGIPIAVKDNFCTKDIRTTCASRILDNYVPPFNATVLDRLEGAVLIGKTNLDEFAMGCTSSNSLNGPVKNPWKSSLPFKIVSRDGGVLHSNDGDRQFDTNVDWYIAGGSSGGSAVAVATGSCFGALASDTGGSTRNPASRTGIVGFKPTYGSLSRYGLIPLTHSMDVPGIMGRTVDCCEQIFDLIRGKDIKDSTSINCERALLANREQAKQIKDFKQLKIGLPFQYECSGLSDEIKQHWQQTADHLASQGARVEQVSLPHNEYSLFCYLVLNSCEVASNFSCYDGVEFGNRQYMTNVDDLKSKLDQYFITRDQFDDEVKQRIFAGNYFLLRENYEDYFLRALKIRRLIIEDFKQVFDQQEFDLILTPVTKTETPLYSQYMDESNFEQFALEDYCTQAANMAGLPAISLPSKLSSSGLPLSLQLIAPIFHDFKLLAYSKLLEKHFNFPFLVYFDD